jgi:glutathione peroxidase
MTIYQFEAKKSDGTIQKFSDFEWKVLLIINTASACGFTPQYESLEKLYAKYDHDKFVILAFPCNQFGAQESGTDEEIQSFCKMNYGVTFPVFSKIDVNGENTHPLYQFLKSSKKWFLSEDIKWNFTKFLVDQKWNVVDRYAPTTDPLSIRGDIDALLA